MAHIDWKRYYAPILVHKQTGECRIWKGKLFRCNARAYKQGQQINASRGGNFRCIGIAAIRGNRSNPRLQAYMAKGAHSK